MQGEVAEFVRQTTLDTAVDQFKQNGNRIKLLHTLHGLHYEFDDAISFIAFLQRESREHGLT